MPGAPVNAGRLVRLLRQSLSETDARDIGNDFGQRAEQGFRLYDRLPGEGLDARLSALVERAQQLTQLPLLLQVCRDWRPDLTDEIALTSTTPSSVAARARHNLPPRHGGFFGREQELARVLQGLTSRYPLVSIEGIGGVGKTSLAVQAAYAGLSGSGSPGDHTWDFVAWLSAMDKPDQKAWLNDVLNTVATVMDYFSITQLSPSDELEHKKAEVDRLLRTHKVLVVVDNFETIDDADLVDWLERVPEPSHVLITSRETRLQKTWVVALHGLEVPAALDLIRQEARAAELTYLEEEPDEALLPLVEVTDGNPRAIEMAMGYIKGGDRSFSEVLHQLRNAGEEVDAVFDYLFTRSWDLLSNDARTLLMAVPLFEGSIARDALRTVSGLPAYDFGQAVKQLVNTKFLDVSHRDGRYAVHPITRAFSSKRLSEDPQFEAGARARWSGHYLDFVRECVTRDSPPVEYWNALVTDGMTRLDAEWLSALEVLKWADREGQQELLLDLVLLLVHYMDSRFYNLERLSYVIKAIAAAEALGRREVEALLRIDALGWTCVEEYRLDQAGEEMMAGLEIARALDRDPQARDDLVALGSAWLARLRLEQGDDAAADQFIREALETPCRPWIKYRVLMAAGDIALKQGNGTLALSRYERSVTEYQSYGGEGHGYQIDPRIGLAYVSTDRLDEAEAKFAGLRRHEQLAIGKLHAEYGMALVAYRRGEIAEARRLAAAARQELQRRTTSNLLLQLIDKLFQDLEEGSRSATPAPEEPS